MTVARASAIISSNVLPCGHLLGLFVFGLIAGAVARLVVRSPRRLGCLGTAVRCFMQ